MNQPARNGPTVAFDEFGPLEIRPQHGRSWRPTRRPDRLPATYTRKHGVRHWLAFYDLHDDKLWGYTRGRKRSREVLEVLKRMRRRYPAAIECGADCGDFRNSPGGGADRRDC